MNRFLHQLVRQRGELKEKGGLSLKEQETVGHFCPVYQPEQLQDGRNRAGSTQASRHWPSCAAPLHPQRGAGTLLRGPTLPEHTQVLCPHNLLSPMDLQHGDSPPWLLNLQTLCQLLELLLLSKTLVYLANALTNDKPSVYSGLFVTSCSVNVLGKQRLTPPSANKMAFSVVFTGRARFL